MDSNLAYIGYFLLLPGTRITTLWNNFILGVLNLLCRLYSLVRDRVDLRITLRTQSLRDLHKIELFSLLIIHTMIFGERYHCTTLLVAKYMSRATA